MASNVNNNQHFSLDELEAMKCTELREILKQNVSGNKQILVARCYALNPVIDERKNVASSADTVDERDAQDDSFDPLFRMKSAKGNWFQ